MSAISEQAASDIRAQFLDAMSRAAFCVNIVTTDGPAGRAGVTVSAMSSVPPTATAQPCWSAAARSSDGFKPYLSNDQPG